MMTTATTNTISNTNTNTTAANTYIYTTSAADSWTVSDLNINVTPSVNNITCGGRSLQDCINEILKGENNKMPDKFKFGPIKDGTVAFSMRGIAVKNACGEWVCYDEKQDEIINVDGMIIPNSEMIFAMPVALKDVQIGSLIIHNKHYCYVLDGDESILNVIDISDGSVKDIMPTKSPFGFNFITKVTSPINIGTPSADNPFGDNYMLYLMMMNGSIDKNMLPLLMMQKGQLDPMMLMMLYSK